MNSKAAYLKVATALLILLIAASCSKKSSDASKETEFEDEAWCKEILESAEIMDANEWLALYPESDFSQVSLDEDDSNGTLLAPVVARLYEAGAQRIVMEYDAFGKAKFLIGVLVILPSDPDARQKLFEIDSELSALNQKAPSEDHGQKCLYYSLD